jgi:hypothetical protein
MKVPILETCLKIRKDRHSDNQKVEKRFKTKPLRCRIHLFTEKKILLKRWTFIQSKMIEKKLKDNNNNNKTYFID